MIDFTFEEVGQGDSLLIEWSNNNDKHIGIIDCNISNDRNPILQKLIDKNIKKIDFIIITHLHYDHYSGFATLFKYCILNRIEIGKLYHTFEIEYFRLFTNFNFTQQQWKTTDSFIDAFEQLRNEKLVIDLDRISNNINPIPLTDNVNLSFLSPIGMDYADLSSASAKYYKGDVTTVPNLNNVATIILITNEQSSVILTSDAPKKAFKRLNKKTFSPAKLVQAPHHGSIRNLDESFWIKLNKSDACPAVFSIGEVKKDKLPNISVVEFFDKQGYYNHSTNYVYGIAEFYGNTSFKKNMTSIALSSFTKGNLRQTPKSLELDSRFFGSQSFSLF